MIIDLRSDTITRPTPEMLQAMMQAEVGDDVFGDDPTVNRLQEKAALMFNMDAALFCPSGTMTNQIALKVHTQPGDEIICDELSHVYRFEGGGAAFNSGASMRLLKGDRGRITAAQVLENINNPDDIHLPYTRLVVAENTANKGGGSCYNLQSLHEISKVCHDNNLSFHLDGARLFNALTVKDYTASDMGNLFDSISICLSKGLGAPVGSLLLGSNEFISKAVRVRKVLGGGMRQSGYLAAAGIYALDHHVERLKDDHRRAKEIASALQQRQWVEEILPVETNILIFRLAADVDQKEFIWKLDDKGIKVVAFGPQLIRIVTHLDFTDDMLEVVINTLMHL